MISPDKLDRILDRFADLEARLASELGPDDYVRLSKEYAEVSPVAEAVKGLRALEDEIAGLEALIAASDDEPEMRELAETELETARERLEAAETELRVMLLPSDEADRRNVILEARPGTGGEEAALFAGDLMRMYARYAEARGWRFEMIEENASDLGGLRDGVATISGAGAFARLKYESGVHRVQRVPETESSGRIHTSAATVAVLPEAEEVDVEIEDKDLRIDTMRASGAGGQHVNTTDSAVRITHLPTGIVVTSSEKSQHQNRAQAMKVLRARLFDMKREAADDARAAERRAQIGSGDRSERIRTYNFPQGRVTDHRINLTLYKLERVMMGEALDELVDALTEADQAARLAADPEDQADAGA